MVGVGGWGRVKNFKQLSLGYAKEIKGFFFLLGQEIEWKIGGGYEELSFWLRLNLE